MLSQAVFKFIQEIKQLNTIGCITVDQESLKRLAQTFQQADLVLTSTLPEEPQKDSQEKSKTTPMPYVILSAKNPLPPKTKPCIWVITEEDYSNHPSWAQEIRNHADYFLNVR